MNDQILPTEELEEQGALTEREETPPNVRPRTPRREPPRRQSSWVGKLTLIFSFLALVLAAIALYLTLAGRTAEPEEPPAPPEPETFQFGGRVLEVLEGMPVRPYAHGDFSLDERGRIAYGRDGISARTGIDVSFYQQEIDWPAVAADGIDFAILRLGYRGYTQGGLMQDKQFGQNLQGALDAGLDVGVYFFSQAITPEEAAEEAGYVLSVLDGAALAYPIAFDWEHVSEPEARTKDLTGEELTQCAKAFCARIREGGYEPAVYFNQTLGYLHYDLRELTDCALWLAEYGSRPDFYYHFDLWQYSHTGTVAGIEGNVDLDLDLRPTLDRPEAP